MEDIGNNSVVPEDDDQDTNNIDQPEELTDQDRRRGRRSSHRSLPGGNGRLGPYWNEMNSHIRPILGAILVAEQAGVQMMKEYFEIEASKSTQQYEFRKGLKLFGDKGYQDAKEELKKNLLGRGCIDMLS